MKTLKTNLARGVLSVMMGLVAALPSMAQSPEDDGQQTEYTIVSVGINGGRMRIAYLDCIRRMTWAQYALWSNNNRDIYFKNGEVFNGAVHANSALYFTGDPTFYGRVTSAASWYGGSIADVAFKDRFSLGVPTESMSTVDFGELENVADLVLPGASDVVLSGTNMVVTNSRNGWNKKVVPVPKNGLVYVKTVTTGSSSSRSGDLSIKGELDSRVTFATDRDINITDHLTYVDDPKINVTSKNALGLISKRDIVVKPSCSNDLKIYAHMIATGRLTSSSTDGSFGVEGYDSGKARGTLNIHGGIAQDYRGPVGTFSIATGKTSTGFDKNYTYDTRFSSDPPPHYPPIDNLLGGGIWRER